MGTLSQAQAFILIDFLYFLCLNMAMYVSSEVYPEIDGEPAPISLNELINEGVELPGASVTLRPLTEADAEPYFQLIDYDRDHLSQFGDATAEKYHTVDDVLNSLTDPENPFKLRFGVWDNETMVGSINLTPLEDKRAEIGYWVGKQFIGNGYAPDALNTLSKFAFTDLGYDELEAEAVRENNASQRVLEKAGFEQTGEIKGRDFTDENGEWQLRVYLVYAKQKP